MKNVSKFASFAFIIVVMVIMAFNEQIRLSYKNIEEVKIDEFSDPAGDLKAKLRFLHCDDDALPKYIRKPQNESDFKVNYSDCNLPYVTMNFKGQLGNNICQYFSLLLLQKLFDVRIAVLPEMYEILSHNFKEVKAPLVNYSCYTNETSSVAFASFYKTLYDLSHTPNNLTYYLNESVYVYTHPCNAEILMPYRRYFKSELEMLPEIVQPVEEHLQKALNSSLKYNNKTILVSVHVRRTDYFHHMEVLYQRKVLNASYYYNAMDYFRKRFDDVVFIVSSDDLKWCKENLSFDDVVIAGKEKSAKPIFDFVLISLCDHHIIGLGTYGFLSAFMGKGIITYPVVDTDRPSEMEISYVCSNSPILVPIMEEAPPEKKKVMYRYI